MILIETDLSSFNEICLGAHSYSIWGMFTELVVEVTRSSKDNSDQVIVH